MERVNKFGSSGMGGQRGLTLSSLNEHTINAINHRLSVAGADVRIGFTRWESGITVNEEDGERNIVRTFRTVDDEEELFNCLNLLDSVLSSLQVDGVLESDRK